MEAIQQWFDNGAPFEEGVAIYKALPVTSPKVLRCLDRGKNAYNTSLLIKELRQYKTAPPEPPKPKKVVIKPKIATDVVIAIEHLQQQQKAVSSERFFKPIKYAELPPQLKLRYREVKDVFYQMCDLKFALNDLPAKEVEKALAIQLQIEELDTQRSLIWKELEHWQKHKTELPSTSEDFSKLPPAKLVLKKANIKSSITKLNKRIDNNYKALSEEKDKHQAILIENKINKAEKLLHQHKLNLIKIDELI